MVKQHEPVHFRPDATTGSPRSADDERLVRRQFHISVAQDRKLQRLREAYGYASAAEVLREAIEAFDPALLARAEEIERELDEIDAAVDCSLERVGEYSRRLAELQDPAERERVYAEERERLEREYAGRDEELLTLGRLIFSSGEEGAR